jgi:hypothetical protein
MLLRYHWGHGVGHAYSHVTWTEADSCGNHFSTHVNALGCSSISNPGNFEPNIDSGGQDEVLDTPDDWDDWDSDSNSESDDPTTDHGEGLPKSNSLDSEEEVLTASHSESESIHPGIDVLEYDDYRY